MKEEVKILDLLKKQGDTGGFKEPDDYFDSFEDKMMDRIAAEEKPLAKKIIMVMKPWASLAAIFLLVALIYYSAPYLMPSNKNMAHHIHVDEMSMDFMASSFDESELINFILEDDNSAIFEEFKTDQNLLEGLSIEDVEGLVIF
ncbi:MULTISPECIES: hypothetical protein [unclassified Saccharicrinis]|uniref:hypothetical protein n=1 Tax=unclassified Saccharicrinis TaxID=2646859 RepID=UPI003D33C1B5